MSYCQLFMLYLVNTCNCDITQQVVVGHLLLLGLVASKEAILLKLEQ